MTRETKLGLVVAGAFVSLLTVVVYHKLQEGANAAQEPVQVVQPKPIAPKKTESPAADPKSSNGVKPATFEEPAPVTQPNALPIYQAPALPPVIQPSPGAGGIVPSAKSAVTNTEPTNKELGTKPAATVPPPPPPSVPEPKTSMLPEPGLSKLAPFPEQLKTIGTDKQLPYVGSQDLSISKQETTERLIFGATNPLLAQPIQPVGATQTEAIKPKPVSPIPPAVAPAVPIPPPPGDTAPALLRGAANGGAAGGEQTAIR